MSTSSCKTTSWSSNFSNCSAPLAIRTMTKSHSSKNFTINHASPYRVNPEPRNVRRLLLAVVLQHCRSPFTEQPPISLFPSAAAATVAQQFHFPVDNRTTASLSVQQAPILRRGDLQQVAHFHRLLRYLLRVGKLSL